MFNRRSFFGRAAAALAGLFGVTLPAQATQPTTGQARPLFRGRVPLELRDFELLDGKYTETVLTHKSPPERFSVVELLCTRKADWLVGNDGYVTLLRKVLLLRCKVVWRGKVWNRLPLLVYVERNEAGDRLTVRWKAEMREVVNV